MIPDPPYLPYDPPMTINRFLLLTLVAPIAAAYRDAGKAGW